MNEQGAVDATAKVDATPAVAAQAGSTGAGTPTVALEIEPVHCPYRRTTDLLQRLAPGKMRVAFFVGAGCPLAIQVEEGGKKTPLIPKSQG